MATFAPFAKHSVKEGLLLQFGGGLAVQDDPTTFYISPENREPNLTIDITIELPEHIGRSSLERAVLHESEAGEFANKVDVVVRILCPITRFMRLVTLQESKEKIYKASETLPFSNLLGYMLISAFVVRSADGEKFEGYAANRGNILLSWPVQRVFLEQVPTKKGDQFKTTWRKFDDLAPGMEKTALHLYDKEEETAYLNENAGENLRKVLNGEPGFKQFASMILTPIAVDIREQIARSAIENALVDQSLDLLQGNEKNCLNQMLPMLMNEENLDDAKQAFEDLISSDDGQLQVRQEIIGSMLPKVCQHQARVLANMDRSADSLVKIQEKENQDG